MRRSNVTLWMNPFLTGAAGIAQGAVADAAFVDAAAGIVLNDPVVAQTLAAEDPAQIRSALARYQWKTNDMGTARLAQRVTPPMLAGLRRPPSEARPCAAEGAVFRMRASAPIGSPKFLESSEVRYQVLPSRVDIPAPERVFVGFDMHSVFGGILRGFLSEKAKTDLELLWKVFDGTPSNPAAKLLALRLIQISDQDTLEKLIRTLELLTTAILDDHEDPRVKEMAFIALKQYSGYGPFDLTEFFGRVGAIFSPEHPWNIGGRPVFLPGNLLAQSRQMIELYNERLAALALQLKRIFNSPPPRVLGGEKRYGRDFPVAWMGVLPELLGVLGKEYPIGYLEKIYRNEKEPFWRRLAALAYFSYWIRTGEEDSMRDAYSTTLTAKALLPIAEGLGNDEGERVMLAQVALRAFLGTVDNCCQGAGGKVVPLLVSNALEDVRTLQRRLAIVDPHRGRVWELLEKERALKSSLRKLSPPWHRRAVRALTQFLFRQ